MRLRGSDESKKTQTRRSRPGASSGLEKAAAPVRGIPKPLLVGICVGSIREDVDRVLESWRNPS
jgi:hypothetical protein